MIILTIYRFSEKLAQFVDETVRNYHDNKIPIPESFVADVMLLLNMLSQKATFESLYRAILLSHIIECTFFLLFLSR